MFLQICLTSYIDKKSPVQAGDFYAYKSSTSPKIVLVM